MPAFMDGHFDVERAETGQMPKHPGMSSSRGESTLLSLRSNERLSTSAYFSFNAGAFARESRSCTARWAGRPQILVEEASSDRNEVSVGEAEGVDVIWRPRDRDT